MSNPPRLLIEPGKVVLSGEWTLAALLPELSSTGWTARQRCSSGGRGMSAGRPN